MGFFSDVIGAFTGSTARKAGKESAKASREAAATQAEYMYEALDYLKSREAVPQQYREAALARLGKEYTDYQPRRTWGRKPRPFGVEEAAVTPGDEAVTQAERIALAKESPLYGAIMGTQAAGEESILRSAGATGMLRSGTAKSALAESAMDLEREALLQSYNEQLRQEQYERQQEQFGEQMELAGLQTILGVPSMAPQIAQTTSGIGETYAMGQVAGAQARAQGQMAGAQTLQGTAQLGALMYDFSDVRLKDDVRLIGAENGYNKYRWKWNKAAAELGLFGEDEGFMAHELPESHLTATDDYLQVRL